MSKERLREPACRTHIVTFTATAAIAMLMSGPALAFDLFCVERSGISFWLGEAAPIDSETDESDHGRSHFFFDTATGQYIERRVNSRAAITDSGHYDIVHDQSGYGRDILALKGNTTLHIHVGVERTAFLRVDRGAIVQIGTCEPVTE